MDDDDNEEQQVLAAARARLSGSKKRRRQNFRLAFDRRRAAANLRLGAAGGSKKSSNCDDDDGRPELQSKLVARLLDWFAWGTISPQQVQKLSHAAVKDVRAIMKSWWKWVLPADEYVQDNDDELYADFKEAVSSMPELEALARLGNFGQYPNKVYAHLMQQVEPMIRLPECFEHRLMLKKPMLGRYSQRMMLPHELFAHMYEKRRCVWDQSVLNKEEPGRLAEFWNAVKAAPHPAWEQHPLRLEEESGVRSTGRCVPISLHRDEVPVAGLGKVWGKKMVNFSWSSHVGVPSTKDGQFWIWGMFEKTGVETGSDRTLDEFFKVLRWSFYWLWRGQWPNRDVSGKKSLG